MSGKPLLAGSQTNRRAEARHPPRARVKIECRKDLGLGPNLATAVLDISQIGAKITTTAEIPISEEVEIKLLSHALQKPVKVLANVVRIEALKNGAYSVGVRFQKPVTYAELRLLTNF
jgi:c-di-GMP-binding flagellar brake protein YcgR